jgi:hypothetical protein
MANYVISKVRYNKAGTHIDEVVVNDEGKSVTRIEQRSTVVANIKATKTYRTQPPGGGAGAAVRIVDVNGAEYLRTDANKTAKDNLDNLPTF